MNRLTRCDPSADHKSRDESSRSSPVRGTKMAASCDVPPPTETVASSSEAFTTTNVKAINAYRQGSTENDDDDSDNDDSQQTLGRDERKNEQGVSLAESSMTDVQSSLSYLDPYRNISALSCNSGVSYDVMPKFPPPHPYFVHQNPGGGGLGLALGGGSTDSLFALSATSLDGGLGLVGVAGGAYGFAPSSGLMDGGREATGFRCMPSTYELHSSMSMSHPMLFSSETSFLSSSSPCPSDHSMVGGIMSGLTHRFNAPLGLSGCQHPTLYHPSCIPSTLDMGSQSTLSVGGAGFDGSQGGGGAGVGSGTFPASGGPVVFPIVYVSPAGLLTVLMRQNVAVEMTLDRAIRVVNHQHRAVAASNSRGNSSCIYHEAAKVYQDHTTTELDLYGDRRAKMTTGSMIFGAPAHAGCYSFVPGEGLKTITEPGFKDLSQDMSVTLLFSSSGYGPNLISQYKDIAQGSRYKSYRNGAMTVFINGARIHQTPKGDVVVWSGRKYLRVSPVSGLARVVTHFVEMTVGQNWVVRIRRGGHKLRATGSVFVLANDNFEFGFNAQRQLFLQPVSDRPKTIILRGRSISQPYEEDDGGGDDDCDNDTSYPGGTGVGNNFGRPSETFPTPFYHCQSFGRDRNNQPFTHVAGEGINEQRGDGGASGRRDGGGGGVNVSGLDQGMGACNMFYGYDGMNAGYCPQIIGSGPAYGVQQRGGFVTGDQQRIVLGSAGYCIPVLDQVIQSIPGAYTINGEQNLSSPGCQSYLLQGGYEREHQPDQAYVFQNGLVTGDRMMTPNIAFSPHGDQTRMPAGLPYQFQGGVTVNDTGSGPNYRQQVQKQFTPAESHDPSAQSAQSAQRMGMNACMTLPGGGQPSNDAGFGMYCFPSDPYGTAVESSWSSASQCSAGGVAERGRSMDVTSTPKTGSHSTLIDEEVKSQTSCCIPRCASPSGDNKGTLGVHEKKFGDGSASRSISPTQMVNVTNHMQQEELRNQSQQPHQEGLQEQQPQFEELDQQPWEQESQQPKYELKKKPAKEIPAFKKIQPHRQDMPKT